MKLYNRVENIIREFVSFMKDFMILNTRFEFDKDNDMICDESVGYSKILSKRQKRDIIKYCFSKEILRYNKSKKSYYLETENFSNELKSGTLFTSFDLKETKKKIYEEVVEDFLWMFGSSLIDYDNYYRDEQEEEYMNRILDQFKIY